MFFWCLKGGLLLNAIDECLGPDVVRVADSLIDRLFALLALTACCMVVPPCKPPTTGTRAFPVAGSDESMIEILDSIRLDIDQSKRINNLDLLAWHRHRYREIADIKQRNRIVSEWKTSIIHRVFYTWIVSVTIFIPTIMHRFTT